MTPANDLQYEFLLSEFIYSLCFFKFFIPLRTILSSSIYYNERAKTYCQKNYNFSANLTFCLKSLVNDYPILFSFGLVGSFILFCALQCRMYERPYQDQNCITNGSCLNFGSIENAIYCTIITMTTVGYGDFYPTTIGGRLAESCAAILGQFVLATMVVSLANQTKLSTSQSKAYNQLNVENFSARAIDLAFQYWILSKDKGSSQSQELEAKHNLRLALKSIAQNRLNSSLTVDSMLEKTNDLIIKINKDLEKYISLKNQIPSKK